MAKTLRIIYRHEHACSRSDQVHAVEVSSDEDGTFELIHPLCFERAVVFGDLSELRYLRTEVTE